MGKDNHRVRQSWGFGNSCVLGARRPRRPRAEHEEWRVVAVARLLGSGAEPAGGTAYS